MRDPRARAAGALAAALLAGCAAEDPAVDRCNGSAALCDRPLDEVTFAGTHNSMSSAERDWWIPNQHHAVPRQLADGIRALNLDLHEDEDGEPALCHGYCELGSQPLVDGLAEIDRFLADHPGAFIVITFESYLPAEVVAGAFVRSGLEWRVRRQAPGEAWPTLGEMLAAGEQVAVFSDEPLASDGGSVAGYLDQWSWWVETPYHFESVDELLAPEACAPDRGEPDNDLFGINHFLTAPVADEDDAALANDPDVLAARVAACTEALGRPPNQVLVDFYDEGGLLAVVAALDAG